VTLKGVTRDPNMLRVQYLVMLFSNNNY